MNPLSNPLQEKAAQLLAEGRYELGEIAEKIEVDRVTLYRWRKDPEFAARVEEISREFAAAALKRGLARKEYRVNTLANLHSKLQEVIEERAADPVLANIPGGQTGLIVQQFKVSGETVIPEYAIDTGLIKEIRAIQEQVAKELGQLVEKKEMKIRSLEDLSDEELDAIIGDIEIGSDSGGGAEGEAAEREEEAGG
jgi:Helix-turn-helix of insertion element transposase